MYTLLVTAVVGAFFLLCLLLGLAASWRRQQVSEDYFLAGRTLPWYAVGLSIAGTSLRLEVWIGLIGLVYTAGLATASLAWGNALGMSLLVWVLLPYFLRKRLYGPAEFLERRYSPATRGLFVFTAMLALVLGVLVPALYMGGWVLCEAGLGIPVEGALSWAFAACIATVALVTAIYSVYGGLRAGVWSGVLQLLVVIAGGALLAAVATRACGGLAELAAKNSGSRLVLLLPRQNPLFPWTGVLAFCLTLGVWNAASPISVQRCLGARSEWDAKMGGILGGLLGLLLAAAILLPGLSGLAKVGAYTVTGMATDQGALGIIETLFGRQAPLAALGQGLVVSAVLAAVMSTVSGVLTAVSGLWTMDICQDLLGRRASEVELVGRGRRSSFVTIVLGAALAPLLLFWDKGVVAYVLEVAAVAGPPVAVLFLVAFFWSRSHGRAAAMTLFFGLLVGLSLWFIAENGEMVPEWMLPVLNRAGLTGAVSLVLLVLGTLVIPQNPQELYDPDTSWCLRWARLPGDESEMAEGPRSLLFWWCVVILATAGVWIAFR